MNWLTNFIRPKIRSIVEQQKDVPENLWSKCPSCEGMLFHRDLLENINVCYHCGHHMRISVAERLTLLFDEGRYKSVPVPKVPHDPLKFKDRKKYADRLKEARAKTGRDDAIIVAKGTIGGAPTVIAAFDFAFMGGSMGTAVGEGLVTAAQEAIKDGAALIAIPASGGARMQEGALSLMQMPRSIVAVEMVKDAGLPYIVILTDPTTGGVSASFAMVGDIHIAEPGCMIGFAGKRVIQETIREELPEDFQTAEYCMEHGMVDMVVPRKDLHETLGRILGLLFNTSNGDSARKPGRGGKENPAAKGKNGKENGKKPAAPRAAKNNVVPLKAQIKKTVPAKQPANVPAPAVKKIAEE
ncbi:MAG: acetyl-CoA carboxylase carboxyltransferase subunit beta [Rhodospirillales bacterium]|nr:acetyl-CoA carboxylase carboxyltransferase subunit beta [Rhodospirillales bacterium]